jgi:hypothetical protein
MQIRKGYHVTGKVAGTGEEVRGFVSGFGRKSGRRIVNVGTRWLLPGRDHRGAAADRL